MSAPVGVSFSAPDGTRLYSSSELAALLGVTPSAVSNYRKRSRLYVAIPDPLYASDSGRGGYWTGAQVGAMLEARLQRARELELSARARMARASSALERATRELERAELAAAKFGVTAAPSASGTESRASERIGP